jgi:LIVCS family branched-chain amino acid:cation transporter
MAGEHLSRHAGLPGHRRGPALITIIAVAKAGNGWAGMTKLLPAGVATALAVAIYIIIGPAFAAPVPAWWPTRWASSPSWRHWDHPVWLPTQYCSSAWPSWSPLNQGKLMDAIGKYLTRC